MGNYYFQVFIKMKLLIAGLAVLMIITPGRAEEKGELPEVIIKGEE